MILYDPPPQMGFEKSLKGVAVFALDFVRTPYIADRILPAWPIELVCGLSFLAVPVVANMLLS